MTATPVQVDPEKVISRLSQQVGSMAAELAMRDAALEGAHEALAAAQARVTELEATAASTA